MDPLSHPHTPKEWSSWDRHMFTCYQYFQRLKKIIDDKKRLTHDSMGSPTVHFGLFTNHKCPVGLPMAIFYEELCEMILILAMFLEGKSEDPVAWWDSIFGRGYMSEFILDTTRTHNSPFITSVFKTLDTIVVGWFQMCLDEMSPQDPFCFNTELDMAPEHISSAFYVHVMAFQGLDARLQRYVATVGTVATNRRDIMLFHKVQLLVDYVLGTTNKSTNNSYLTVAMHRDPMQWMKDTYMFCNAVLARVQSTCDAFKTVPFRQRRSLVNPEYETGEPQPSLFNTSIP